MKKPLTIPPGTPRFPYVLLIMAFVLITFTLVFFGFGTYQILEFYKYNIDENRLIELEGAILHEEEATEMSLRLAVLTGDINWNRRYEKYDKMLDQHIVDMHRLILQYKPELLKNILDIDKINANFDFLQDKVIEFIKQNKLDEAKKIIFNKDFLLQEAALTTDIQIIHDELVQSTKELVLEYNQRAFFIMLYLSFVFMVILLTCFFSFKKISQWKYHLEQTIQRNKEYEFELNQSNLFLEDRVKERTLEINQKNKELINLLDQQEQIQKNLIQSEKMATIGQLSAGIAHEINNPLSVVMSNSSVLKKRIFQIIELLNQYQDLISKINESSFSELKEVATQITQFIHKNKIHKNILETPDIFEESSVGLDRIKKIVANLGSFSKTTSGSYENININDCIESALEILWNKIKYKCEIVKELGELPQARGSPEQIKMVLMAIILNAVQSISDQGKILIRSQVRDHFIEITITDTGCGIPPENLTKIFDPFFTTKPIGSAIGLGLSSAYAIIKAHNGDIRVQSELGKGTTFIITLPIIKLDTTNEESITHRG